MAQPPPSPVPSRKAVLSYTAIITALLVGFWTRYSPGLGHSEHDLFKSFRANEYQCQAQGYTTEIISTDPLLILLEDFVSGEEARGIIETGEADLKTSGIQRPGSPYSTVTKDRTSSTFHLLFTTSESAPLPLTSPHLTCLLSRARDFMGPSLLSPHEDFGTPQLVRYAPGEHFDEHYDWYENLQPVPGRRGMWFNRVASFFVYLDDDSEREGGETWFPRIEVEDASHDEGEDGEGKGKGKWKRHEEGGVMFTPKRGRALFWVNLMANGTGDRRVIHAGLPLTRGVKSACNIWPRRFYVGGR
ncbi:hypothetical protein BJ875DRAFT_541809 [Amylocarpus encephaloides]|uniref:Fe2OG dioxygenase domain-containing protein n=1 Tax=Amylocarpus encephaloides TaxID=45428 RepID=A0A9P7YMA9_9HELO|nr:hypothetical protein BJ875DRAFT_541809 [Amylocarpus encephaloides]